MRPLDPLRRKEYQDRFRACAIRPEKLNEVRALAARILAKQDRYRAVQDACGVPWFVVGVLHSLEGGLDFGTHLHNGDPLTARTVHDETGANRGQKGAQYFGPNLRTWVVGKRHGDQGPNHGQIASG